MKLKKKYNKWLYNKYGWERGALFENIPFIYRICPLFSPSLYCLGEAEEIGYYLKKGLNKKIDKKEIDNIVKQYFEDINKEE